MQPIVDYAAPGHYADTLIVLLPGAKHGPADFVAAGFVGAVRTRNLPLDLCLAELAFSDVADESALAALHAYIIEPAQARNYRHIWLAGISIGGYLAMAYARYNPDVLRGLLLLAPYPGNRMTTNEIHAAGGIARWTPTEIPATDTERHNWLWLKTQGNMAPEVHLAYGAHDRFAPSHAMMAEALPPARVNRIDGAHVWPVWYRLWCDFLDQRLAEHGRT